MFKLRDHDEWDVPSDCCYQCQAIKSKEEDLKDWLLELVDQVYSNAPLDPKYFERCLGELCHLVDMKAPDGEIAIQRKEEPVGKPFSTPFLSPMKEEFKKVYSEYLHALKTGEII